MMKKSIRQNFWYLSIAAAVSVAVFSYAYLTSEVKRYRLTSEVNTTMPSFNLTIHDTGLEFQVTAQKASVQQVLTGLGIKLYPQDSITPTLETPLSSGLHIVIERRIFKREVSIPFETIYVEDEGLLYGREVIRQYGNRGLKEETYLLNADPTPILNANQTPISSEEILEEKILIEPTSKIIARGTKIVPTGFMELGQASWCKPYSGWGYVAAHPILGRGSKVLVTNLENQRKLVVKIVDWGPDRSVFPERVIDLSPEAFVKLGIPLVRGIIKEVKVEEIE